MALDDASLLKLDEELEQIFLKRGRPKLPLPTKENIHDLRRGYSKVIQRLNISPFAKTILGPAFDDPTWVEIDHKVKSLDDGGMFRVRTYTPKAADGAPCVLFCHGGGWCMGDLDTEALFCRWMCSTLDVCVINVGYRLYPEVKFGTPTLDVLAAVYWVSKEAKSFNGDPHKGFIVGGNSGGGTFASIAVHFARDSGMEPPITGCLLQCPIISDEVGKDGRPIYDRETQNRSVWQNKDAPLMTQAMADCIYRLAPPDPTSRLLTPLLFDDHQELPRCFTQVCGLDPWRDLGILYHKELLKAGNDARLTIYPGLPHCWWTTYPQIAMTTKWLNDTLAGLKWLLEPDHAARL